ncbi:MarR family winged helix-turn-helix transcriptional regulator [Paenibacillus bovis]|uniref:MarR family transcriptional regulator n=1 Tax=Paenibacillus bovis TaxID=1616788 RepID=A0A172ZBB2_9BACL|nr:MarR family transcriptional regulator [Paenibacillus bovis]ANF94934.1 MarR family transcriptional regulator [Paenibacillus bovis]
MNTNDLFQQFVAFIASVHQVSSEMTRDIPVGELTPAQYKIMEYLMVSQPVTLSEISECIHMSMPNTSRELRKLTDKGLCEKVTDPQDRRKQLIRLSDQGSTLMDEIFRTVKERFVQRTAALSGEEKVQVEQALTLLRQKILD